MTEQRRFKTVELDFGCDCGECDDTAVYLVVNENMPPEEIGKFENDDRILCDCDSRHKADFIVTALNRLATN